LGCYIFVTFVTLEPDRTNDLHDITVITSEFGEFEGTYGVTITIVFIADLTQLTAVNQLIFIDLVIRFLV
jgi:hypothetical protein